MNSTTIEQQERRIAGLLADIEAQAAKINELDLWKRMHDMAPAGAKAAVVERMQQAEAIQPFIESWRQKCAEQAAKIDELRHALKCAEIGLEGKRGHIEEQAQRIAELEAIIEHQREIVADMQHRIEDADQALVDAERSLDAERERNQAT